MTDIEVYYFPPEIEIPPEVLPEIIQLDYEHMKTEYLYSYEASGGVTDKYPTTPPQTPDELNHDRKAYNQHWCIAMKRQGDIMTLAGFMYVTFNLGFNSYPELPRVDNCLVIQDLITHPACRKQGVATTLLEYAYQLAKQHHIKNLALGVTTLNKNAVRLYEKQGFRVLETNYFGAPPKASVSQNFCPMIPYNKITKDMRSWMEKSYREFVSHQSRQYYPLYGQTNDIMRLVFERIDHGKYPIFLFGRDHGWCVMDQIKDEKMCSFYPLCITPKGMQNSGQLKKYLFYMSSVGQRLFKTNLLWFGVIDPALTRTLNGFMTPFSSTRIKNVY